MLLLYPFHNREKKINVRSYALQELLGGKKKKKKMSSKSIASRTDGAVSPKMEFI